MIEIIEKEPYYDESPYTGNCWMYPTYMVKDGKELFMFNRRVPDDSWVKRDDEARKKFLIENDGKYFIFYSSGYADPFEMIRTIAERKHSFTENNIDKIVTPFSKGGIFDFHGNRREVSAGFFFRIYDEDMAAEIKDYVGMIMRKEYEAVCARIQNRNTD